MIAEKQLKDLEDADEYSLRHHLSEVRLLIYAYRALQQDKARLDSGCIIADDHDEFGSDYRTERRGLDLRKRIDEAMARRSEDLANV